MLVVLYLIDFSNGNMILGFVPESLALMLFGICLIGVTLILRRMLNRHDEQKVAETPVEENNSF